MVCRASGEKPGHFGEFYKIHLDIILLPKRWTRPGKRGHLVALTTYGKIINICVFLQMGNFASVCWFHFLFSVFFFKNHKEKNKKGNKILKKELLY